MLNSKLQDEAKALELCKSKVRQRKLPMEVIDAEYQWCVAVLACPARVKCPYTRHTGIGANLRSTSLPRSASISASSFGNFSGMCCLMIMRYAI